MACSEHFPRLGADFTTTMLLFGAVEFPLASAVGGGYLTDRGAVAPQGHGTRPRLPTVAIGVIADRSSLRVGFAPVILASLCWAVVGGWRIGNPQRSATTMHRWGRIAR